MEKSIVDKLYTELSDLRNHLEGAGEISLQNSAEENFRKTFLLASASYFDARFRELLLSFFRDVSKHSPVVVEFAQNTAINSRKYHTLFEWDGKNVNNFYKLFGEDFKTHMLQREKTDTSFAESAKAFLEVGRERNRLIHQNFAAFSIEKNTAELYDLYKKAYQFVVQLPEELRKYAGIDNSGNNEK
jgi:hypothetical protein